MTIIETKARIKLLWDAVADEFEKKIGDEGDIFRQHQANPMIFNLLHKYTGEYILDVGCGNGYLLSVLRKKGFMVDGLDVSPNQLKYASKRAVNCKLYEADIEDRATLPTNKYDSLICSFVLDSLQNLGLAFSGCFHLLKHGGHLIVNIPHPCFIGYDFWKEGGHIDYVIEDNQGKEITLYKCTKPVLFFQRSLSSYLNAVTNSGFIIKEIFEPDPTSVDKYISETDRKLKPAYLLGILAVKL